MFHLFLSPLGASKGQPSLKTSALEGLHYEFYIHYHQLILSQTWGLEIPYDTDCLFPKMGVCFHWKKPKGNHCKGHILSPDSQQQTTKCVKYCETHLYLKRLKKEKNLNLAFAQVVQ